MKQEKEQIHQFFSSVITHTFFKEGIAELKAELAEEIETKKTYLDDDFESNGLNRYFLFAYKDDRIIGSISYGPPNSIIVQESKNQMQHLHEIGSLLVDPKFQNQGIGNKLLQGIFQALREKGNTEFCFDSGYKEAQNIWVRKFGDPLISLENYWGENSHHMIWRKKLAEV